MTGKSQFASLVSPPVAAASARSIDVWLAVGTEVWVGTGIRIAILVGASLAMAHRRANARRMREAFAELSRRLRLTPITDERRRDDLSRALGEAVIGDAAMRTRGTLPLANALEHTSESMRVSLLSVQDEGFWSGTPMSDETGIIAVVFDRLDNELPQFTLRPTNAAARFAHGPGLFPTETKFGRHNLVHSFESEPIGHLFSPAVQAMLAGNDAIAIRAQPHYLMIHRRVHGLPPDALPAFVEDAVALGQMILENAGAAPSAADKPR